MRIASSFARAAACVALVATLAACGNSSSTASSPAPTPQTVSGVQTPSQISVVTAK